VWDERDFGDPLKAVVPQWRVMPSDVPAKLGNRTDHYRVGFGDVANPRNERTFVAALIPPRVICGDKVPTLDFGTGNEWCLVPYLAVANSFVIDWLTRGRLSSAKLSFTVMDALPIARLGLDDERTARLAPLVLRLSCTGIEMTAFWNMMSEFGWTEAVGDGEVPAAALLDPGARADARAEIDAVVAKALFGLTRDELAFILDSFDVLRRRDERAFDGDFHTKTLILDWYDKV
jgi:hypothetical protein